ncbi:MAG: type II toxin-antitoxin system PemK/MazF family toxin [Acidobacteria bacterium]|nr:MAG: type II toxin-antitoxin system PemK/MazF family toxin [Acidobacteriota bacterium]
MPTSGDIVELDLGAPTGQEAGFRRPAVLVTAQELLDQNPSVIQVVPITSSIRGFGSEVVIEADTANGLDQDSAAQCHQIRAVSAARVVTVRGNVGAADLHRIRETIALVLDIP